MQFNLFAICLFSRGGGQMSLTSAATAYTGFSGGSMGRSGSWTVLKVNADSTIKLPFRACRARLEHG
jgi:hypothetical protein